MQKKQQNTATRGTTGTNRQSGAGNRQSGSGTSRSGESNQSGGGMNRSGGNDSSGNTGQSGNRPGQPGKEHNMKSELSPEEKRQAARNERREEEWSIPDDTDPQLDEQDMKENNLSAEGADKIEWDPES